MIELEREVNSAVASDVPFDWPRLRKAIHDAHGATQSSTERVKLLQLFKQLMDHVATTQIASSDLAEFNESRAKDYRLLLVQEGLVGDNACVDTLDEITRREISAGRMSPDDELRQVTIQGLAASHPSRAELEALVARPRKSFWANLLGKR